MKKYHHKKMIKKFCILILGVLLLTSCDEELPRHILGDYYLCQTKIDLSVFYLVEDLRDSENKEAAARVGISGQYIYWETGHCHEPGEIIDPGHKPFCHPTIYRIDTQEKKEVRVDEIPEHVKMYPAEEFYYMLEEGHISDLLRGW